MNDKSIVAYFDDCGRLAMELNKVIAGEEIGKGYMAVLMIKAYLEELMPDTQALATAMIGELIKNMERIKHEDA